MVAGTFTLGDEVYDGSDPPPLPVKATPPVREVPPRGPDVGKNADAAGRNAHATMTFIAPARPSGSG